MTRKEAYMIIFKVKNQYYQSHDLSVSDDNGVWHPAKPQLLYPNLFEWFRHAVLRQHFSFGQEYCVVCGKTRKES